MTMPCAYVQGAAWDTVNQVAFVVAWKQAAVVPIRTARWRPHRPGVGAVDGVQKRAQQVQVGAVQKKNAHGGEGRVHG